MTGEYGLRLWAKPHTRAPYRMDDDMWIGYTFSLCTNHLHASSKPPSDIPTFYTNHLHHPLTYLPIILYPTHIDGGYLGVWDGEVGELLRWNLGNLVVDFMGFQ
jgi:hypothetical protein